VVDCNDGRLPLVLGVGGNDTRKMLKNYKLGIFFFYCNTLRFSINKPTQEGIYQHFKAISQASPIPIIIYNVPKNFK
jgi:4-hydroxy-tetrahydrodipicolinate synthase